MYCLVVYDIADTGSDGRKVLSRVFKISKKYLHPIQKSVFEGELSDVQLTAFKRDINKVIRDEYDSVIIFEARQEKWLKKVMLGKPDETDFNIL